MFCGWEEKGVSKVSSERLNVTGHFLPHSPVIKTDSLTIGARPVFGASCKIRNSHSLNKCLFKGPKWVKSSGEN